MLSLFFAVSGMEKTVGIQVSGNSIKKGPMDLFLCHSFFYLCKKLNKKIKLFATIISCEIGLHGEVR